MISSSLIAYMYDCTQFLSRELHPELNEKLSDLKQHLLDSTNDLVPLKVWQLQGKIICKEINIIYRGNNIKITSFQIFMNKPDEVLLNIEWTVNSFYVYTNCVFGG